MKIETTCSLTTVKELCEAFWKIEKELNLVEFEINSVKIWQHLRMQIYYKLAESTCILDKAHEFKAQKNKFFRLVKFFKESICSNPFFNLSNVDNVIFDHPRSRSHGGELIDVYTDHLVKENIREKNKFVVIERTFDVKHLRKKKVYVSYMDFFILTGEFKARFFKRKLTKTEKVKVKEIEESIYQIFKVNIHLSKWFEFESNKFQAISWLFLIYFKKKSPKRIYMVVSYSLAYVVKAAKECGIKVIELQHGVISRYHMGYSYPGLLNKVDYFPDKFWTWGTYWNEASCFPLSAKDIIVCGNYYFNAQRKKYLTNKKIKNTILVVSQGVIGNKLVSAINEALPGLAGDYQITFKLHPGEYDRYMDYDKIDNLLRSDNVTIEKDIDLFYLFSTSEYQVGVFSTAIYEGLSFGCKTVLVDLPGIEYMEHLLNAKKAKLCNQCEKLKIVLDSFENSHSCSYKEDCSYDKDFFNTFICK